MKLRNKKTGEIINAGDIFELASYAENGMSLRERHEYKSLSELCDEWEDYNPAEPLIKDEKIRKAVLAWCAANDIRKNEKVKVLNDEGVVVFICCDNEYLKLVVIGEIIGIRPKKYTITELCGDEE